MTAQTEKAKTDEMNSVQQTGEVAGKIADGVKSFGASLLQGTKELGEEFKDKFGDQIRETVTEKAQELTGKFAQKAQNRKAE